MSEALPRIGWIDNAHGVRQRDTVTPRVSAAELDRLAMLLGDARCSANAAECAPTQFRLRYLRSYLRPAKATKSIAALLALAATTAVISQFATKTSHDLASSGSLAARGMPAAFDSSRSRGDGAMRGSVVAGVLSAGLVAGSALAQDAVQWRVEDGGNGHWYTIVDLGQNLSSIEQCTALIASRGALPCVFNNAAEWSWWTQHYVVSPTSPSGHAHQGLYRAPNQSWKTFDGQDPPYTAWTPGLPNNPPSDYVVATAVPDGGCFGNPQACWEDYVASDTQFRVWTIEYSADCNSDGIVDFGQIRAGELEDTNANNIPDCCEGSVSCEGDVTFDLVAHYPFDGNCLDVSGFDRHGIPTAITFDKDAAGRPARAAAFNGINSQMLVNGIPIPTSNAFTWALWIRCETIGNPSSGTPILQRIEAVGNNLMTPSLFVRTNGGLGFGSYSFAFGGSSVETAASTISAGVWTHIACSSSANGLRRIYLNGTVIGEGNSPEYGQALGRLLVGRDRIDCCGMFRGSMDDLRIYSRALTGPEIRTLVEIGQPPDCPADIDESGAVNAIDLAIVIGYWGTDGGKDYPQADIDGSGEIDGADLATLLGSWGPCE
jgi:hypothetical protein